MTTATHDFHPGNPVRARKNEQMVLFRISTDSGFC